MFQLENILGIIVTDRDGIVESVSYSNGNFNSNLVGVKWYNALKIPREEYNEVKDECHRIFSLPEEGQKISVYPSYGEKEGISGLHILVEKIDEEEDSAQYLNKMLCFGKVVPGIAHEICNPLTYVSGWLQMFLSETRDNDPKKKTYETLIKEFERIAKLVRSLLAFTKQTPKSKQIFDVNQAIEDVLFMVVYTMKNENIELAKDLLHSELLIEGDSNKLKQVILNLLQNSRESMSNGGKIYLSTNLTHNNSIVIRFRDTGCGLTEDQVSRIFRPFYTTKTNGKGAGLGLSICKAIVEEFGGTIDFGSKVGEGTVVTIDLPSYSSN
ncbi:MAG: sensor histidine kinase [Planctomycetota bacterium]|jgi:signal transduction histidine kinase